MRGDSFLDTNILVYAFDPGSPQKREKARALIEGSGWCVSWQVVQEFSHVALHRFFTMMCCWSCVVLVRKNHHPPLGMFLYHDVLLDLRCTC